MNDRTLPHNLEAEKAVLAAVMIDAEAWAVAASILQAADFFRDAHARIFGAMLHLVDTNTAIDLVTLKDRLAVCGQLDEVGGPAYIAALVDGMPRKANVAYYAAIVREKSRLRGLIRETSDTLARAYMAEDAAFTIADQAIGRLCAALGETGAAIETIGSAVAAYSADVASGAAGTRLPFGYLDLDALTGGGFRPGDLVIVAARPSTGKSSFVLGTAERIASAGQRVLMFPLETGGRAVARQLLSWKSHVPAALLESGHASDHHYGHAAQAACELADVPLLLEEQSRTVAEVTAWCRRAHQEAPLSCVIVDYMQLLALGEKYASETQQITAVSRALKRLARDLDIGVIGVSQLSRAPEARRDKRPKLSDLRGSGALEQDTDLAILLFREEMYNPTHENMGTGEAIVAKHRTGAVGPVHLAFNADLARFLNLAPIPIG